MPNPLTVLSLDDLRRRTSTKWRHYAADVLPMWVAEMDVPVAEPVARAIVDAVALGDTGYPAGTQYAEALADFAVSRWDWRVDVEATALVPDVMLGIVEVLRLVTGPGDAVVVTSPVYTPFYLFLEHMGRRVIEAPLTAEHRIDPGTLEMAFARATAGGRRAGFLLSNPHNPTGTVHTREELATVAELADRHGVHVVSDENHAALVYPEAEQVPYLSLPEAGSAFCVLSASKAWNLAGLKAALALAGPDATKDLARMPEHVGASASHLGVIAHSAALHEGRPWLDDLMVGLDQNRQLLRDLLAEHLPGVGYRLPQATFLAWLDCTSLGLGEDPAAVFLHRGRVALNSGPRFGTGGAGHVRLNFATSPEVLVEGVRRMAAAVG
jgi:cystathionine beta-lyase